MGTLITYPNSGQVSNSHIHINVDMLHAKKKMRANKHIRYTNCKNNIMYLKLNINQCVTLPWNSNTKNK